MSKRTTIYIYIISLSLSYLIKPHGEMCGILFLIVEFQIINSFIILLKSKQMFNLDSLINYSATFILY